MASNRTSRASKREAVRKSAAAQQAAVRKLQQDLKTAQEQLKAQAAAHDVAMKGACADSPKVLSFLFHVRSFAYSASCF